MVELWSVGRAGTRPQTVDHYAKEGTFLGCKDLNVESSFDNLRID